mmetsp:Transcript_23240/g.39979  ORF Transcript_23240/g.39979 Transcript_23240/m.39979 type:complete len:225 (+) Transcript_23240:1414-2088(+)
MGFVALIILQTLVAGANGQNPIRPHLNTLVQGLQRLVVKGVFAVLGLARPDHRLVGIGEPLAPEIWHRIRLAPNHIVQNPEAFVLQGRSNAEDVVIAADDPDRTVRLEQAAGGLQPGRGEFVIGAEGIELIPMIINRIHLAVVGAMQIAFQLQVIGRIGKDQINRAGRQAVHHINAVARNNLVQGKRLSALYMFRHRLPLSPARFVLVGCSQCGTYLIRGQFLF